MICFKQNNYFGFGTNTVNVALKAFWFGKGKLKYVMNFVVCNWKIGIKTIKMRLRNAVKLRNEN